MIEKAFAEPHRTYASPKEREEEYVKELRLNLKDLLKKELLDV